MEYKVVAGKRITAYTSTFPARRYWYRHDTVLADGVLLVGRVQVKSIGKRIEVITCYKNSCVLGRDLDWLERQNKSEA